jgi:hypothetical protein
MKFWGLLALLLLGACDQNGFGVGTAVKNFFMTPVDALSGVFTDAAYQRRRDATLAQQEEEGTGEIRYCVDPTGAPIPLDEMNSLDGLAQGLRSEACQCVPWGDCPKQVCACGSLCPRGFEIFRHPAGVTTKALSTLANGLSFRNVSIGQHEMTAGYCWGHARLTSQFNRLAFFKPEEPAPHDINSTDPAEQERALKFYKDLIDKIDNNKAVNIPGYPDLQSFSKDPAIQSYLGDKMAKGWANQAMSWLGLFTAVDGSKQSNESYLRLFTEVKERIDMHMQPTIVFTSRGSAFVTHAVLVSHYETLPGGKLKLCLRDNNKPEERAASCEDSMVIDPTNGLEYSAWGEIGSAKLVHNENADATAQAASLERKCSDEKGCSDN